MKNIQTVLITIVIFAGFSSCNKDFLTENPKGVLFEEQLNTPTIAEAFAIAAYSSLDGYFTGGVAEPRNPRFGDWGFNAGLSNWNFSDVRSDDAYKGGGGTGDQGDIHSMEIMTDIFPTCINASRRWKVLYAAIKRCNDAIKIISKMEERDYPVKNVRIAEMKFLRGHFYFQLKIVYNKVPWIDETLTADEVIKVKNDLSSEALWAKIEGDFATAKAVLPVTQREKGRATKYAASTYLAKTYLYQKKFDKALIEADEVINSGKFGLLNDYTKLWQVEFENSQESIFAIQYSIKDGSFYGNVNWANLLNVPRKPTIGTGYDGGDGFFQSSQNAGNVYKTDVNGLPLFDTYNNSDVTNMTNTSIDVSTTVPVDPRLDHNIGRPGIMWLDMDVYNRTWVRDVTTYGQNYVKKGLISVKSPFIVQGFPWAASALNTYILRYADLLLIKAECLIEMGGDINEARILINQVRNRAKNSIYVMKKDMSGPAANYKIEAYPAANWDQVYARKALQFERRLEFMYEGQRFFDLVRWDMVSQTMNEYFRVEKTKRNYLVSAQFTRGVHEYMPIPQDEMDLVPGIYTQNPGY